MLELGIATGLLCGLGHAVTYLFSRRFVTTPGQTSFQLLVLAHLIMGGFSAVALALLWRVPLCPWGAVLWPLGACTAFYFAGQACLFQAMRLVEPSRVASLLGLKIPLVALLVMLAGGAVIGARQWAAIGLVLVAANLLRVNRGQAAVPVRGLAWVGGACCGYALSDFHILRLIRCFDAGGSPQAAGFCVALSYALAGLVALVFLGRVRPAPPAAWRQALPFAVAWYFSMLALFATFALVGTVLGVILQATRGVFAVVLGALVAHWGHVALEEAVPPAVRLRQAAAALLMLGAIALYVLSASGT